jgi:Protein of unknown function (DUF509).
MEHEIQVLGFSTVVEDIPDLIGKVDDLAGNLNSTTSNFCVIQLLNSDGVAGEEHVLHAAEQAILAFKRKRKYCKRSGPGDLCTCISPETDIKGTPDIRAERGVKQYLCSYC